MGQPDESGAPGWRLIHIATAAKPPDENEGTTDLAREDLTRVVAKGLAT